MSSSLFFYKKFSLIEAEPLHFGYRYFYAVTNWFEGSVQETNKIFANPFKLLSIYKIILR